MIRKAFSRFSRTIFLILTLLISVGGCTVPGEEIGSVQTFPIRIAYFEGNEPVSLSLDFGAAELNAAPDGTQLLEGSVAFNVGRLRPTVNITGRSVSITQRGENIPPGTRNQWDLHFGTRQPIRLEINAGAYQGHWDLGGVPIQEMEINQGASQTTFDFSAPNPIAMEQLTVRTGAADVELMHLGNARFQQMKFQGGASTYNLDFSGAWNADADVEIQAGVASLRLLIPRSLPARIECTQSLSSIHAEGFRREGRNYYSPAWDIPTLPHLTITIASGLADIELELVEASDETV